MMFELLIYDVWHYDMLILGLSKLHLHFAFDVKYNIHGVLTTKR